MALIKCRECGNQVSNSAKACPQCGAKIKKGTSVFTWLVVIVLAIVLIPAFMGGGQSPSTSSSTTPPPSSGDLIVQAMRTVSLKSLRWKKGGFDNVMLLSVTIDNQGERAIKDIEITCTHAAKSGTEIDSNRRVLYDVVPAKSSKAIKEFNMGVIHSQAAKSGCEITGLKIA